MSSIAIVANGSFPRKEYPRYVVRSADKVVCCDGALQVLEKAGIVPDAVVGDLDSVCGRALRRFAGTVVRIGEQDTNDLSKAFHYAIGTWPDVDRICIVGATGKREDHTVANLSLLADFRRELDERGLRDVSLESVSDYSTVFPISDSAEFYAGEGRNLSFISLDPTLRIRSQGLEWPLDEVVFSSWWTATLNRATADRVSLRFSHPAPVLVFLD